MVELVDNFVKALQELDTAEKMGSKEHADESYRKLYVIYIGISNSDLDQSHKEIAYDQVRRAFERVSDFKKDKPKNVPVVAKKKLKLIPIDIVAAGVLILVLGALLFVKPQWIGLAVFDGSESTQLNLLFSQSSKHKLDFDIPISSLKLSGQVSGAGSAKVYALTPRNRYLVFDSADALDDGKFSNACVDTCFGLKDKELTLEVELDGTSLYIDSVSYSPVKYSNHAPRYVGEREFTVGVGKQLTVNIGSLFIDEDKDRLTYLSTSSSGLTVDVLGDKIVLTGVTSGVKEITLLVSDGQDVARQTITVNVV